MDDLLQTTAAVAGITTAVKVLVDVVRAAAGDDLKSWVLPMTALGLGLLFAFLLAAASDPLWSLPLVATTIIRGVMGGAGAVGVTEFHKMARGKPSMPIVAEVRDGEYRS